MALELPYDTRLAAYAVILDDAEKVLLAFWNGEGRGQSGWTLPGGGVHLHETCEQAVVREVEEETGYEVRPERIVCVDSFVVPASERLSQPSVRPLKAVRVIYEGQLVGGQLRNEIGGSTDEARWWAVSDVAELDRVPLVDIALGALSDTS